jgi:hypothetical protein
MPTIEEFISSHRWVYYIPEDAFIDGRGYRVSFVFENVDGHYPSGTWPYDGSPGQTAPYFWGADRETAEACAQQANESRGISREDTARIVASSMMARTPRRRRRGGAR